MLFETPSHAALLEKVGVRSMVSDIFDELLQLAEAQDCSFPADFKEKIVEEMVKPTENNSIMYQDFMARRPMEVETYLGSPIKLAQSVNIRVPRIETLYALLHNLNTINKTRPKEPVMIGSPNGMGPAMTPRMSSAPPPRPQPNGMNGMNGGPMGRGRGRTSSMGGAPPGMRRGPPPGPGYMNGPPNGYGRPPMMNGQNGHPQPPRHGGQSRRGSMDGNELGDEFNHLVLYDDIPEAGESNYGDGPEIPLRDREMMLRQREAAFRDQEMRMRRGGGPAQGPRRGGGPAPSVKHSNFDDDDDDDDFFDPASAPPMPMIDPDNFDMMSVTSKRNRMAPTASQMRKNPDEMQGPQQRKSYGRPSFSRNRSSQLPAGQLRDMLMDDDMMGLTANRYGTVDRQQMGSGSRTNSLTAARLNELQFGGSQAGPNNGHAGPYPGPGPRRTSHSPGHPYSPAVGRGGPMRRPSPPDGYMSPQGPQTNGMLPMNGRPSPPAGMRQPMPRYPPGQGNSVAPQQVEQEAGVSTALHPPKNFMNNRSLTGSASASAGSGDSAVLDENSAHSSQSSLAARGVGALTPLAAGI